MGSQGRGELKVKGCEHSEVENMKCKLNSGTFRDGAMVDGQRLWQGEVGRCQVRLMGIIKRDHITAVLASLLWLPVKSRIEFKILRLQCEGLKSLAASYLKDIMVSYYPDRMLSPQSSGFTRGP